MEHNLVVTFEIRDLVREGALITAAIEELGQATRVFSTTWYVRSELSAQDAASLVWNVMNPVDGLLVLDLSSDLAAMFNIDNRVSDFMANHWRWGERSPQVKCEIDPAMRDTRDTVEARY
jgi:hypothetical protein